MSMTMTDHRIRTLVAAPHRLHSKKNNIARRTRDVVIAKTAFGLESLKVFVHSVASEAAWRFNNRPRPCPPPKPLPAELWIQIIEQDSSREEWIALAKTCWFFHQIAQPCLYKHATVGRYCSPNHTTTTAAHKHNHSSRRIPLDVFSRTIQCRADLAAFVRNLTLHAAPPSHAHEHTTAPAWLTRLPNLTTLHLTNYTLTPAFCGALRTLPRLRLTRYEHCRASSDLLLAAYPHPHPHPHSQHPSPPTVAVEIRAPHICKTAAFPNAWTAVVPAGVAALALHCTPPAYLDLVLSSIMLMRGNAQLTALSLGTSYPPDRGRVADTLPAFLASAPLLRRLALNFWTSDASVLQASLPADAVPLLEDFTGPPALFDVFLRGRPVRRVGAFFDVRAGSSVARESLVPLALSAVPVTELALDVGRGLLHSDVRDVGIGACLLHAPVSVRRLTWSYVSAADLLTFLPALSRLKNLRELRVGGVGGDCTPLSEIAAACPKLCEVYTERHVWVRRREGREWDRFLVGA